MASVTRTVEAYRQGNYSAIDGEYWDSWASIPTSRIVQVRDTTDAERRTYSLAVYKIAAGAVGTLSAISFEINITETLYGSGNLIVYLFTSDPTGGDVLNFNTASAIANKTTSVSAGYIGTKSFSFSGLNLNNESVLYIAILPIPSEDQLYCGLSATSAYPKATATVSYPVLAMSVTPTTVGTGNPVTISFSNRAGQQIALTFKKGSTTLYTTTASSDSIQVTPTQSWFETAGGTGTSMTVSVSASDQIGRTASGSFNLTQPELAIAITPATVGTGQPATISISNRSGQQIALTFKKGSTTLYTTTATSDSIQVTPTQSWFETAGGTGTSMTVSVSASDQLGRTASGSFNLTQPELTIAITPATVGTGQPATISISNRSGQQIALTFKKGSTTLYTMTATSDYATVTPTNAWFTTAGETGTSMTVNVSATDAAFGRTASGSFLLKQALTVTTSAPKNTTRTATDSMYYSWSVSGNTTQASAELYINGAFIRRLTGSENSVVSSYRPPAGTVSWFVRVTNNLDITTQSDTATFTIQYVSTSYLAPYNSKTSGSINRFRAQTFSVQMRANGTPYTDYTCEDAVFYWKQSVTSVWHRIAMTQSGANGATVTIPANTFPQGTIQWYAEAGDGQGNTRTSSTYSLSTVAVPITATPISPIDTVETASTPTVFTWRNSGTITIYPAAAQLQYSENNLNWTDFGSVTGSASTYTAEAGTLPSGQVFWRVRVQNVDDVWGSWSDPVTFINFGAPSVSQVLADDKPFTTITWTSSTQQAYRITIDGSVVYGTYWSANVHAFTLPLPLADGAHTAAVEVQNEYGQWSQPAQTDFTVTNVPGDPVTLTGLFDRDAELSWSTTDATSDFLIYRDGVQIGHASGRSFTDRVVLGYHIWRVINRLPGGYYTASNVVSGTLMTGRLAIAPLSGGAWLELTKSENSARSVVWNEAQRVVLRQFAGQIYPQAEAAPYKTMSAGFDVAWTHAEAEQADIFASLIGQPVIFKTPCEGAMVGILTAWQRNNTHFYRSYSATVQRIHWRDYVDAGN